MNEILNKQLTEYKVNIDLWKHAYNIRQEKNKTFLQTYSVLTAVLGALLLFSKTIPILSFLLVIGISIVGIFTSTLWLQMLERNAAYTKLRPYQLRFLEKQMGGVSTFTRQYQALYLYQPITYEGMGETFKIEEKAKVRSVDQDSSLANCIRRFWICVLIVGIVGIVVVGLSLMGQAALILLDKAGKVIWSAP